jgi:hypothetical protein
MFGKVTLKDEKIIDRWSMIVENAQGLAEQIYTDTEANVQEMKAPGISFERVQVRPSWLKGLLGNERSYMMVTNDALGDYRMFIGVRDYGDALDIQWYMTCEPGFFSKKLSNVLTSGASDKALSLNLDIFQQQDLSAYATVVHHCMLKAIEKMMTGKGQDTSQIDRKSKGFLGIS